MATTKIWPVKTNLLNVVTYVMDPEKTFDGKRYLASGLGLAITDPKDITDQMMDTKKIWGKTDKRLAYHAEQSFAYGEVTPEVAHEIGVKMAEQVWGDRFEVLVTTHLDKEHIHNHFVINSVSWLDGKKYHQTNKDYDEIIRKTSDRLCREYGLSVVEQPGRTGVKSWPELHPDEKAAPNIRTLIYQDIDNAIQMSANMEEFYDTLRDMGYEVHTQGANGPLAHAAIKPPTSAEKEHRFFRLYKFAPGYTEEDIARRIENRVNGVEDPSPTFLEISAPAPKYQNRRSGKGQTGNPLPREDRTTSFRTIQPEATTRTVERRFYMYSGRWFTMRAIRLSRYYFQNYFLRRLSWHGLRRNYLQFCFVLKSVQRVSYPKYPTVDLRRELHSLQKYSEQALLLNRHKIDTSEQLQTRLEEVNEKIHSINKERKRLRHKIKQPQSLSPEVVSEMKERLEALSEEISPLYRERALLKDIAERSEIVERAVQKEKEEAKQRQKQEIENEAHENQKERNNLR